MITQALDWSAVPHTADELGRAPLFPAYFCGSFFNGLFYDLRNVCVFCKCGDQRMSCFRSGSGEIYSYLCAANKF